MPEQSPLRVRDPLAVCFREVDLLLESVRLGDLLVGGVAGILVVRIHADDVDHVVARVAAGPADRVRAAVGGEIEPELLPGDGAHRVDDAPPVRLPVLRVRCTAVGVGDAVHLPAEHDDRVRDAQADQPLGQLLEVPVVRALRARLDQPGHLGIGHPVLVVLLHGHVEDEHPVLLRPAPVGPVLQEADAALDARPLVTGQIGVPDADLPAPEPARQEGDPGDAARPVVEVGPHGGVRGLRPVLLGRREGGPGGEQPGRGRADTGDRQSATWSGHGISRAFPNRWACQRR